jgi:quercetin dioxygenase-like cupin family protein
MDLKEIMQKNVGRFSNKVPDWNAFPDTKDEGFKRAQFRMIGSGGARKQDPGSIEAQHFTLSIMCVPPGQGGRSHAHEVEEAFFMLKGHCVFFLEDEEGNREEVRLGPWDVISCPQDVYHGFYNDGVEDAFMQVIIGTKAIQPIRFRGME